MSTSEEKLKQLRRSRGGHKAFTTRIIKECEGLIANKIADGDDLENLKGEVETNLQVLREKMSTIKGLDEQILDVTSEEETDSEIEDAAEYQRGILRTTVAIERWQKRMGDKKPSENISVNTRDGKVSQVKLQRINLKHYDGDPLTFQSFWDSFDSAVHSNEAFDDVLKFNHLKSLLEGKALLAIQGLTLTKENYEHAVEIIKTRFGDPQVIIKSHMDALLAIKPVMSNKVADLREVCDIIEVHTRNLQQFDVCFKNYGPMLLSIITSKLPKDIKLEIARNLPQQGKWEIEGFMEAFRKEVTSRERCAFNEGDNSQEFTPSSESTLLTKTKQYSRYNNRDNRNRNNPTCTYCRGQHPSKACDKFKDVTSRKLVCREKNKCYVCLRSQHNARDCWSKQVCPECGGRHHIS